MNTKKIKPTVINLIQTVATPHNNVLIEELYKKKLPLNLWYAKESDSKKYNWKEDLTNSFYPAKIYGEKLNIPFLWYCIKHRNEKFLIVGWANINTLILHVLFFILRRRYNHWTDMPRPLRASPAIKARILRYIAYIILRYSKVKVFCVGMVTIKFFETQHFPASMLVNLPIFTDVERADSHQCKNRETFRAKYGCNVRDYLIVGGSRLVYEKGYDLLIEAVAKLPLQVKKQVKVLIVGRGEEQISIKKLVEDLGLSQIIRVESWMEMRDFKNLISCSDIFVHPSRHDAFGGTILAMALGVAVIGSTGAGAAVDRIEHGVNGFLYKAEDTKALSHYITLLLSDSELRERIATAGRATAVEWPPARGVKILLEHAI